MNKNKTLVLLALLAAVAAYFFFDLGRFFSLEYAKGAQAEFAALYAQRPVQDALEAPFVVSRHRPCKDWRAKRDRRRSSHHKSFRRTANDTSLKFARAAVNITLRSNW